MASVRVGSVQVIRGAAIPAGPESQGMTRKMADIDERVSVLEARNAPQTVSSWHHHGDHTTCVYITQGQARIEWGPGGRERVDLTSGDFYVMSPYTIHREGNPGAEDQTLVGFVIGSGPKVVNVEGPEPEER